MLLKKFESFGPVALADVMLVRVVELVKIDHILLKASQAGFTGLHNMLATPVFAADAVPHDVADFRSNVNFVPF